LEAYSFGILVSRELGSSISSARIYFYPVQKKRKILLTKNEKCLIIIVIIIIIIINDNGRGPYNRTNNPSTNYHFTSLKFRLMSSHLFWVFHVAIYVGVYDRGFVHISFVSLSNLSFPM